MLTIVFTVVTLVGVSGLTVLGVTGTSIGAISTLGIGLGTAIASVVALLTKKKQEVK